MIDKADLKYWLALCRIPGQNEALISKIITAYDPLSDFFKMTRREYTQLGLATPIIDYLRNPDWSSIEFELEWEGASPDRRILTLKDEKYPYLLKEIPYPPPVLYTAGNIQLANEPQLAIIGSRKPTFAGIQVAEAFARELAEIGWVITSGLASGIDEAAHKGALISQATIGVIGNGIDIFYPRRNRQLQQKIFEHGLVISEFPLRTPPCKFNFPRRNRIISGLAMGTLVVEANIKSGSLITAKHALEQGREVFAVPGSIYNPRSKGCHFLIKQGAKLVEEVQDIVEEFTFFKESTPSHLPMSPDFTQKRLDADHLKLLHCIGYEPTKSDTLVQRSRFNIQKITSILLDLELADLICSAENGYMRISK